jgi:hypothetical protein
MNFVMELIMMSVLSHLIIVLIKNCRKEWIAYENNHIYIDILYWSDCRHYIDGNISSQQSIGFRKTAL